MDYKNTGSVYLKFHEAKTTQPHILSIPSNFFLTVSFGNQRCSTLSKSINTNLIRWEDSMKFCKTSEEIIMIQCYYEKKRSGKEIVGSAIIPIQTAISKGSYSGTVSLMHAGKVNFYVNVQIDFEEKCEIPFEYPTVIYPLAPPAHPHVHAYDSPPSFTYTPPAYYSGKNSNEYVLN
jgi:C2 domain